MSWATAGLALALVGAGSKVATATVVSTTAAGFDTTGLDVTRYSFSVITTPENGTVTVKDTDVLNPSAVTVGPSTFTGSNPGNFFVLGASAFPVYGVPFLSSQIDPTNPKIGNTLFVTNAPDSGVRAISFDVGSYLASNVGVEDKVAVHTVDGSLAIITLPVTLGGTTFVGFRSSSDINSVTFIDVSGGQSIDLVDFTIGVLPPIQIGTPEPWSVALFGTGLAALGVGRRRRV